MKSYLSKVRVIYGDTDQMGIVHHSNYLKYYETARWSLFKKWKIPYKSIEDSGFLLPVVTVQLNYIKPAYYDEELSIETTLVSFKGAKLSFDYKLFNEAGELINQAAVVVAFVNLDTRKACRPPAEIAEKIVAAMTFAEHVVEELEMADV